MSLSHGTMLVVVACTCEGERSEIKFIAIDHYAFGPMYVRINYEILSVVLPNVHKPF